ncbi:hypothetical protein FRB97_005392 [Tulasnella sp. 331]|nr:hypothetical protein FRB97_005392 [Tulasnella sp. 331]
MVESFGVPADDVGYKTGLLVSMFFVTQFLTSILWAAFADKYGRRAVLGISLLGNALTCLAFGMATTYTQAVIIRLMQGVFNGALGVARGAVTAITDGTNEARAYAIIGFCWGFGGVVGPVIGGAFESPAGKWPNGIGSIHFLADYPYLLPCAVAASITFVGAVFSLFLGWDGGLRGGLIRLPIQQDEPSALPSVAELPETPSTSGKTDIDPPVGDNFIERMAEQTKHVQKKVSGYFAARVREAAHQSPTMTPSLTGTPLGGGAGRIVPIPSSGLRIERRGSQRTELGSSYVPGRSMRSRLASSVGGRSDASILQRRRIIGRSAGTVEDRGTETDGLSFAQRLLLANEGSVTSMANLWVAAAINVDNNENVSLEDTPGPATNDTPDLRKGQREDFDSVFAFDDEESAPATPVVGGGRGGGFSGANAISPRQSPGEVTASGISNQAPRNFFLDVRRFSRVNATSPRRSIREFTTPSIAPRSIGGDDLTSGPRIITRRGSMSSNLASLPAIFHNTGLSTPSALARQLPSLTFLPDASEAEEDVDRNMHRDNQYLSAITEGTVMTDGLSVASTYGTTNLPGVPQLTTTESSIWNQLPMIIIVQYGMLALHNEVHDQYFLTYLVSPYEMGGLGLNAGHFAQLIAMMCLVQVFYQFYLYPNVGPPRGPWSHLAMFRIGSALFIPSYLSVCLYRTLETESEDGNLLVMTLLALSTALRFCGITFVYTAITIMLNYMSPPHLVSLSNSIGQSTVAFMRFVGPIAGGYLWSYSIKDGASGSAFGFYVVSAVCLVAILQSFTIR